MKTLNLAAVLVAIVIGFGGGSHVDAATLTGTVQSGGTQTPQPLANVLVTLYEATDLLPITRGFAKTNAVGQFSITTSKTSTSSIFFAVASLDLGVDLVTIIGPDLPGSITINELTTVAAAYSMAQFYREGFISGPDFPLQLAAMMNDNVVSPATGQSSHVLLCPPNADQTISLRTTRALANLLAACVKNPLYALMFYQSTRTPAGLTPINFPQAMANLARNPGQNVMAIYTMTMMSSAYQPTLTAMPDAWTVTVKVNDSGNDNMMFAGPGNLTFDNRGYAWVSNNVTQGDKISCDFAIVLKPNGQPSDGTSGTPPSPLTGGGLLGGGFGVAIDPRNNVWFGNFGWGGKSYQPSPTGAGSVSQFTLSGTPISGSNGYQGGTDRVQGMASDCAGNIWMASYGNDQLVVFLNGNPNNALNYPQARDSKPFGVWIAPDGTGWLTDGGGFSGDGPCSVSRYRLQTNPRTKKPTLTQLFSTSVGQALKAVVIDSYGNAWVASQRTSSVFHIDQQGNILGSYDGGGVYYPWGLAIDGEDNVWVANFGPLKPNDVYCNSSISKLCGSNPFTRPPGTNPGDPISPDTGYTLPSAGCPVTLHNGDPLYGQGADPAYTPMMRLTSLVIDQAGNVWALNNWKPSFNVDVASNPGGDGIVIFVGLAPPPKTQF